MVVGVLLVREWAAWKRTSGEVASARFRRRALGLVLLLIVPVSVALGDYLVIEDPMRRAAYYGLPTILLIWVLLIALRDLNASAEAFAKARQEATLEALRAVEEQLRNRRKDHGDDQRIPTIRGSAPPAPAQAPKRPPDTQGHEHNSGEDG